MATVFPGGVDDLNVVTSQPDQVYLADADVDGGPATRTHIEHHRDLGAAVVAIEKMAAKYDHDHSGDAASAAAGRRNGPKLKQANTHQDPDTDKANASLHHTLGNGQYQAAPGKVTADNITKARNAADDAKRYATIYSQFQVVSTQAEATTLAQTMNNIGVSNAMCWCLENSVLYLLSGGTATAVIDSRNMLPVGSIIPYTALTAPSSAWLICNGQEVAKSAYPSLYNMIANVYGTPSAGSAYFKVPDLRNKFLRGPDSNNRINGEGGEDNVRLAAHHMPPQVYQDISSRYRFSPASTGNRWIGTLANKDVSYTQSAFSVVPRHYRVGWLIRARVV